jgi:hypothetical protein
MTTKGTTEDDLHFFEAAHKNFLAHYRERVYHHASLSWSESQRSSGYGTCVTEMKELALRRHETSPRTSLEAENWVNWMLGYCPLTSGERREEIKILEDDVASTAEE